jgi:riboflavin kinase/FMN adenylyltransferase
VTRRAQDLKVEEPGRNSLVVIGNFDGVHRGHRAVIEAALSEARAAELYPVVLTFDPHPAVVLGRSVRPPLTLLPRKLDLIARLGADLRVVVEPFTLELSRLGPELFAREFVVELLSAKVVIVGENFRFGYQRAGDLSTLVTLGKQLGFAAHSSSLSGDAQGPYSSTRVRAALAAGICPRCTACSVVRIRSAASWCTARSAAAPSAFRRPTSPTWVRPCRRSACMPCWSIA